MKQKLFTLLFVIVAGLGTMQSETLSNPLIGNLYYNLNTNTHTASVCSKPSGTYSGNISIPPTITYNSEVYHVTRIGQSAFQDSKGLTSISIPSSVTRIESSAFWGCSSLTTIIIPNGVLTIDGYAFQSCTGLSSVSISNSVTSIGNYAFCNCDALTNIVIPCSVLSIGSGAFSGTSLQSISVSPDNPNYSSLDGVLFNKDQTTLLIFPQGKQGTYTIPSSVTDIWDHFYGAISKTTIDNLVYVDTYLVGVADPTLSSYTIKEGTKWIGMGAFQYCTNMTSITIPNSVISVGSMAFEGCDALPVIDNIRYADTYLIEVVDKTLSTYAIKEGTKWIGSEAFYGCNSLSSIIIPNSVIEIESKAFYDCQSLTNITIPDGVQSIGYCAFDACTGLTNVYIPKSVTTIGKNAIDGSNFMAIDVALDNPNYCSVDGVLFNKDKSILIKYPGGKQGNYVVPNSVTRIEESAFFRCSLTNLTIHSKVTNIGKSNFDVCYDLISITCESVIPPQCDGDLILLISGPSASLFVPAESVNAYKAAVGWEVFGDLIQPIQASSAQVTSLTAVPTDNTVEIAWAQITNAETYELVIKKNGLVFCTLSFNEQGQLLNIAFAAPAMRNEANEAQAAGFRYTITGLEAGTAYDLTINAKNSSGAVINTVNKSFTTLAPTALEDINVKSKITNQKILHDGQIYILRDGEVFDLSGRKL